MFELTQAFFCLNKQTALLVCRCARRSDVLRAHKTTSRGREHLRRLRVLEAVYLVTCDHTETSVPYTTYAGVAKLVDALALGASGVTHGGSSPLPGTKLKAKREGVSPLKFCRTG